MNLSLNWTKCKGDVWCDFLKVNLSDQSYDKLCGIFIIWTGKTCVYVGSGIIRDGIYELRNDIRVNSYPDLKVVWAVLDEQYILAVRKFLIESLSPTEGKETIEEIPISVNFPWN